MSTLRSEGCENSMIRVANIKRLVADLKAFASAYGCAFSEGVDIKGAANGDEKALLDLLELTLSVAVHSDNKNAVLQPVMALDESSQTALMSIIQDWMQPAERADDSSAIEQLAAVRSQLEKATAELASVSTAHANAVSDLKSLQHDFATVSQEKEALKLELTEVRKENLSVRSSLSQQQSKVEDLEKAVALASKKLAEATEGLESKAELERSLHTLSADIDVVKVGCGGVWAS